jgi:hypothetical protein
MRQWQRIGVLGAFWLAFPVTAAAQDKPTKDQCLDSYERAQASQKDGKLFSARKDFQLCAHDACPKLVTADCKKAIVALKSGVPSVKLSAKKSGGGEPSGLSVTIDGDPAPAPGDDGSIELNPGDHVVRFESEGQVVEKNVSLREGQRGVEVVAEFESKKAEPPPPEPEPEPQKKRVKPIVYALGGVAVLGLGGFIGFGLSGKSKQSDLDSCKPNCEKSDVDSMRQRYLFADISLGLALAAGGAAAYFYFSGDKKDQPAQDVAWVSSRPLRGGGELSFGTTF